MSNLIKRHNFNQALRKIEQFSSSVPSSLYIPKVETKGWVLKHKVTGEEMNKHVETVQRIFINQYDVLAQTIKEFREVYKTFDYLDKEYLQGIVGAVNAASVASDNAKLASDQAKEAATKALRNEEDIKNEIEILKKIVDKIKNIKEDFSSKMSDLERIAQGRNHELLQDISNRTISKEEIMALKKNLGSILQLHHWSDIDVMWDSLETAVSSIDLLREECAHSSQAVNNSILTLKIDQTQRLDALTQTTSDQRNEYTTSIEKLANHSEIKFSELDLQIEDFRQTVSEQHKEFTDSIEKLVDESENKFSEQTQRIEELNQTVSEQLKKYTTSIESLTERVKNELSSVGRQIAALSHTTEEQRKEYTSSIEDLTSRSENSFIEHAHRIEKLSQTTDEQRKEYTAKIESLVRNIAIVEESSNRKIDTITQELKLSQKKCYRNTIIAYIIGGLGIIVSIIALSI